MQVRLVVVPYDSGNRGVRMGAGPLRLAFVSYLVQAQCFNSCPSSQIEMDTLKDIQVLLTGKRTQ